MQIVVAEVFESQVNLPLSLNFETGWLSLYTDGLMVGRPGFDSLQG
jgi:hypothetical protein